MKFKPINAPSATDLFIDQLKTAILTGEYQPGDQLPSERELEKQLHVSRPVINAGLKQLQSLHFINIRPRYGTFIADYRVEGDLATMNEIINFHGGHYRIPLLKSIYRVRSQMETDIIRLAAIVKDTSALQEADFQLKALLNMDSTDQQAGCYFEFIHALAIASHNYVYPLLVNNFKPIYLTLGRWTYEVADLEANQQQNRHLLDLIEAGNADAALQFNQQLIDESYQLLTQSK
jgi:GntR family transcriptional repressor for pyruvate dehydrogenase complex